MSLVETGNDPSTNIHIAYHGRRVYRLFLHIYQLILWKQCNSMIRNGNFPSDIEVYIYTYTR